MTPAVEKLNILSEWETVKGTIMYFSSDCILKHIIEFGSKDKSGNKKRSFEEFRYKSNKYKNYDHLITSSIKFKSYLCIEYPNLDRNDNMRNHILNLYSYSIEGLIDSIDRFEKNYIEAFAQDKDKELILKTPKITPITSHVSPYAKIEFSQDIFIDKDKNKDLGVRLGFNEEYYFTIRYSTTWKEFKYYIRTCDLYGWGISSLSSYLGDLPGTAVTDIDTGIYQSANKYSPVWEDPDDIVNNEESIKIVKSKPLTREERKKSFFDEN